MKIILQQGGSDVVIALPGSVTIKFADGSQLDVFADEGHASVDGLGRALADGESFTTASGVVFTRRGRHHLYHTSAALGIALAARDAARLALLVAQGEVADAAMALR